MLTEIKTQATGWENTEYRSYHFADATSSEGHLVETGESWERRNGEVGRPTAEAQAEMERTYHRELERFLTRP